MEETITILKIDSTQAVTSLKDLRDNVKGYKEQLETLEIGTDKYNETLRKLQESQTALKNAMHATTQEGDDQVISMTDIARAAKGTGESYNALVRQMALLDQQFRATEDAAKRADLGAQIKAINDQLKQMDEARGKFGRNVGDYFNQVKAAGKAIVQDLPSGLGAVRKGLDDVTKSMGLMSKNPILGIVALLAPLINQIVAGLKENETALNAVDKVAKALQPVMDFFQGVLEKIAGLLSQAVDYVLELGQSSGIEFKNIVSGAVGVGNALLQFILTPIRNVIDGAKAMGTVFQQVFKGQFKEAAQTAKSAVKEIGENFRQGFDFKGNFEAGKQVGEQFAAGLKSTKRTVKDAANEVGDEANKELLAKWADLERTIKAREDMVAQWTQETAQMVDAETAAVTAELQTWLDSMEAAQWAEIEAERKAQEEREKMNKARIDSLMQLAGATSSILGSIADLYDENSEADEAAAQKAKALRTASAIIDTISGAVGAYMQTVKTMPAPWNIPVAAANAASVLAAGYAQIRQINATKVGSGGSSAVSTPAMVSAPAMQPAVSQVRNVTSASEVERLNRMAGPQRVYILASDLQAERDASRVRIAETAW